MPAPAHTSATTTQMPDQIPAQSTQFDPAKLADIHLPDAITFWPVAPGWWLLLGSIIIFLLLLIYLIKRKPAIPAPTGKELKSQAMKELQAIRENYESQLAAKNATQTIEQTAHKTVKKLSIFLRRYALSLNQRDNVASLTDEQWLTLLDKMNEQGSKADSESTPFSQHFSTLLTQVPYQSSRNPIDTQLLTELFSASEILIKNSFTRFTAKSPGQKPLAEKKVLAEKKHV